MNNEHVLKFYRKFPLSQFILTLSFILLLLYIQPNPLLWWSNWLIQVCVIYAFLPFMYAIAIITIKLKKPIIEFNENGIWYANSFINKNGKLYSWKDIKEMEFITETDEGSESYYLNILLNSNQDVELNLNNLTQSPRMIVATLKEFYKKPIKEINGWGFYRTLMNIIYLSLPIIFVWLFYGIY